MNYIGVITGDIIDSSSILNAGRRKELLTVIHQVIEKLKSSSKWGKINFSLYRGDSFQLEVDDASKVLEIALILRSALISNSTKELHWDARIGIGVGKREFLSDTVTESDGEAFHLSGKAFDNINKDSQINILTSDSDFNEELEISSIFVIEIIINWTAIQAQLFYLMHIEELTQKEAAAQRNITQQAVSKTHTAAKINLIDKYITRFSSNINKIKNT